MSSLSTTQRQFPVWQVAQQLIELQEQTHCTCDEGELGEDEEEEDSVLKLAIQFQGAYQQLHTLNGLKF